jgi:ATP citrate (pro-S)-lyase
MALRERAQALKAAKMRVFVRRGGPNYQRGLQLMRDLGAELGLPISVYGPESSMTGICAEAIQCEW